MHTWKSFTAKQINDISGKSGTVWQKESFDHIIRSPNEYGNKVRYIIENPKCLRSDQFTLSIHVEEASRLFPDLANDVRKVTDV